MYLGCLASPYGSSVFSTAGGCCWWAAPLHVHMTGPEFPCWSHPPFPPHLNQPEQSERREHGSLSTWKHPFTTSSHWCIKTASHSHQFPGLSIIVTKQARLWGLKTSEYKHKYLLLSVISCGSSARGLAWTKDVYHLLLHLLEDFLKLGVLQHQGPLTCLIVTEQGLVHLTLMAAESKLHIRLSEWWLHSLHIWLTSDGMTVVKPGCCFCRLPVAPSTIWPSQTIQYINSWMKKTKQKNCITLLWNS